MINTQQQITRVAWLMGGSFVFLLLSFLFWKTSAENGWFGLTMLDFQEWFEVVLVGLIALGVPFMVIIHRHLTKVLIRHDLNAKVVEEKLVDYSARLNSFIEYPGHVSIYSLDRNYCYTGYNSQHKREMKETFDVEVENGQSILELLPQDWAERALRNYNRAFEGEHFQVTSLLGERYYNQVFNPVIDASNTVIGLTSSIFEVTEKVLAEQELENYKDQLEELVRDRTRQLERQTVFFQEIIDGLPNLIFVRDRKGRYILVNKAMADTFSKSTGEIVGRSVFETHFDKKEALRFEEEDRDVIKNDEIVEQESYHRFNNGAGKWLFMSKRKMTVLDEEYVLGVHFDINNLKETELKLLKANQELKNTLNRLQSTQLRLVESEKMASLGQLTAGLAHEINNPINYVAGNVSPIRKDLKELKEYLDHMKDGSGTNLEVPEIDIDLLFDELESLLNGVDEGASRVKNLMSDLNNFSLPEKAKIQHHNLNDSLKTTINLIKHHLKGRIELELNLGEIPAIPCNSQQLSQVFLNMLNNAVHAIREEGVIQVSSQVVDEHVVVSFRDSGQGISQENLTKIFDPFFTTKDVGEGTGLGLAISYRIVEEHKGKIEVESTPGEGTQFTISLPIQ